MTWAGFADGIAGVCFMLGAFFVLVAAIGVLRFTDVLTRMHAAAKPQVLGLLLSWWPLLLIVGGIWIVVASRRRRANSY